MAKCFLRCCFQQRVVMLSLLIRFYFLTIASFHWAVGGFVLIFPEAPNLLLKTPMTYPVVYVYASLCVFCGVIYFIFRTAKNPELAACFALLSISLNAYSLLAAFSSEILIDAQNIIAKSSMGIGCALVIGILVSYRNIIKANYRT